MIDAFRLLEHRRLVLVGSGPEIRRLTGTAPSNVTFLFEVTDAELGHLYQSCRALVAVSFEDFGLTPLEAAQAGKPSVVLSAGGYLETMVKDVTAVFVERPTGVDVAAGILQLETQSWDDRSIRAHAELFSESVFIERLTATVGAVVRDGMTAPSKDAFP